MGFVVYILGLLMVANIIIVSRESSIFICLLKYLEIVPKDIFLWEEVEEYLMTKDSLLAELILCVLCSSTHLGWMIGLGFVIVGAAPWWFPLVAALSYPWIIPILYKFYKKNT